MSIDSKNDSGRTMIETLVVVFLTTIIVYGVAYAFGNLTAAARADEINKRIIAMATERRVNMAKIKNAPYKRTEEGPHGVKLTIENGIQDNKKDVFWITANDIHSKTLSNKIADYHSDEIPAKNIEQKEVNGDQEVKIYFDKFGTEFKNGKTNEI